MLAHRAWHFLRQAKGKRRPENVKITMEIDLRNLPSEPSERIAYAEKTKLDITKAVATALQQNGADGRIQSIGMHLPKPAA